MELDHFEKSRSLHRRCLILAQFPFLMVFLGCTHPSGLAMQRLRQLGKVVCDSPTFEASGSWSVTGVAPEGPYSIRSVYGPYGEYRLVSGNIEVIHDTRFVACTTPDEDYIGIIETRSYQPRQGPHHRWPGDVIMASGMAARGVADHVLPYMRLFGENWLDERFPNAMIEGSASELVNGHTCIRYDIRTPESSAQIWVDTYEPIMWMNSLGSESHQFTVTYESVSMNHDLSLDMFSIPDWMFENARNSAGEVVKSVKAFRKARKAHDLETMSSAVEQLYELGTLRAGMTEREVVLVLGEPDRTTGIYVPGGYSSGYGSAEPTELNYGDFFWLHYRAEDWMQDANGPEVLLPFGADGSP